MKLNHFNIIHIIILLGFTSCHSYTHLSTKQEYEACQQKQRVYVIDLRTTGDSMVYFSAKFPGRLSNHAVIGYRHMLLQDFRSDSAVYRKRPEAVYVFKDGIQYRIVHQDNNTLIYSDSDVISIPFEEIKLLHIKQIDKTKTSWLGIGLAGAFGWALYFAITHMGYDM